MCGICGFINSPIEQSRQSAEETLGRMCEAIKHRGNDGHGKYIDSSIGLALGHQRLSIIDIDGGAQPLHNPAKKAWIVFNGEIYNYKLLRKELISLGHVFSTQSDTEVVLESYLEWGEKCVDKFRGMFAFAIWDDRHQILFCARDRIGMKPFYYYRDDKCFIFASEIKSLLKHPSVSSEQDPEALHNFLRYQYIPAPRTIYSKIKKLPAATKMTYRRQDDNLRLQQYWSISSSTEEKPESGQDYAEALYACIEESVSMHLNSDVPLGAFLSGGIDSSAIVGLMSRLSSEPVRTNTAKFTDSDFDESDYAQKVSEHFNTNHRETLVDMNVANDFEKIIYHLDEPFADASAIPSYYLCKEARERVTVCLSGDGGDELFAGYNWYSELMRLQQFNNLVPTSIAKGLSSVFGRILPNTFRGARFAENIGLSPFEQHRNLMSTFTEAEVNRLCIQRLGSEQETSYPFEQANKSFKGKPSDVVKMAQTIDLQTYLVEDILMKVDKMSMAHGLEVRVPLLDHKVVELAMGMSTSLKIQGNHRKAILKSSFQNLMPTEVLNRPKQGFSAPIDQWLKDDLREMFGDLLLSPNTKDSGMFDRKEVGKLWRKFSNNKLHVGLSDKLWTLLCYEVWHSVYQ
jgi:asparagine synthase (glutamine-hydrolysing)